MGAHHGSPAAWRRRRGVSVTPVTEIVDRREPAPRPCRARSRCSPTASNAASIPARMLYASIDGKAVADLGIGEARAGSPMTPDSMVVWFSMTKPSVAVAVAQQWERGALELDDRVVRAPPRVRAPTARTSITLRHLLTHTAGIRGADAVTSTAPGTAYWDEVVAGICAIEPEADWVPGARAGYHLSCGMTLLAEIVRRIDGRRFETVRARRGVRAARHGRLLGGHARRRGSRATATASAPCTAPPPGTRDPARPRSTRPTSSRQCIPGGGGRGPVRQLGASLRGPARSRRARRPARRSRRRRSRRSPRGTASASTTRPSTRSATGASGSRSTPTRWAGTRRRARSATAARSRRSRSPIPSTGSSSSCRPTACAATTTTTCASTPITTALYEDLGLVAPGAPGRDKPFPSVELTAPTADPPPTERCTSMAENWQTEEGRRRAAGRRRALRGTGVHRRPRRRPVPRPRRDGVLHRGHARSAGTRTPPRSAATSRCRRLSA